MYEHADQSWKSQPKMMSQATVGLLAQRLEEYSVYRSLRHISVVTHGGEPTLYGDQRLQYFYEVLRATVKSARVHFVIQTNATLLTPEILQVLANHEVRIGTSIDGPREINDIARRTKSGHGSYDDVLAGIRRAQAGPSPYGVQSILTVISTGVSPEAALAHLETLGIPRADFLLPDWNHDTYPYEDLPLGSIGAWLTELFDKWIATNSKLHIRIFATIMRLLLGSDFGTDGLGRRSRGTLMVETDGSYHIHDGLKTAFEGASRSGDSLSSCPISNIEVHPLAIALTDKISSVSGTCTQCGLFSVCGGGHLVHRYSTTRGYDAPSVYCADLMQIINHIAEYLRQVTPDRRLAIDS